MPATIVSERVARDQWTAHYDESPIAVLPGFQIKEAHYPNAPVAVVPTARGVQKFHPTGWQRAVQVKNLLLAAPALLKAAKKIREVYTRRSTEHEKANAWQALEMAIYVAEGRE